MVKGIATYRILEDKKDIATRQSKPMEEISSSVAVPFTLGVGNLIQKESAVTTHMEITGLKLMANTAAAALMLNPAVECCQSYSVGSESHADVSLQHQITVSAEVNENQVRAALVSEMVIECESNWVLNESHDKARKEDELLLGEDQSGSDESDRKPSAVLLDQLPGENKSCRTSIENALELNNGPLWGCSSICGMRPEMEDAISVKPQLFQVPSHMLMNDHVNENDKHSLAHFFGVYDGHGGLQVCLKNTLLNSTNCVVEINVSLMGCYFRRLLITARNVFIQY